MGCCCTVAVCICMATIIIIRQLRFIMQSARYKACSASYYTTIKTYSVSVSLQETSQPIMCSYKVVKVFFEVWGLQTKVETSVHKVQFVP